jgi:hypothetical protein
MTDHETPSPTQAEADAARLALEGKSAKQEPPKEEVKKDDEKKDDELKKDRRHPESRHLEADKPEGSYQTRQSKPHQ